MFYCIINDNELNALHERRSPCFVKFIKGKFSLESVEFDSMAFLQLFKHWRNIDDLKVCRFFKKKHEYLDVSI